MSDANDEALLSRLVGALAPVPRIEAIALGGSRARGTATAASDYDIGLYYRGGQPIDVAALGKVAASLDDRGAEAEVTPLGGWGPWVDGGGWLRLHRSAPGGKKLAYEEDAAFRRQVESYRELVIKDDQSDCYNRRYFDRCLSEEVYRAQRYGSALSVVFLDLDNLKELNARYGHAVGSKTVREVSRRTESGS